MRARYFRESDRKKGVLDMEEEVARYEKNLIITSKGINGIMNC